MRTIATDLLHREAEIGDYLFEGDACASMAEVFTRGVQGAAIFLGEFLVIVVIDHDFKQRTDRAEFGGGKLIEQGVCFREFVLEIKCHEVYSLSLPSVEAEFEVPWVGDRQRPWRSASAQGEHRGGWTDRTGSNTGKRTGIDCSIAA